jgi:hypothetical protein
LIGEERQPGKKTGIRVIDVGGFDHFGSVMQSMPLVLEQFDALHITTSTRPKKF